MSGRQSTPCGRPRDASPYCQHLAGGVAIRAQPPGSGRPADGAVGRVRGVELDQTACYACTGWHTCLVFETPVGVRLPLCEGCLRLVVPRALELDRAGAVPPSLGARAALRG
jgi:hypothetical protein